MQIVYKPLGHLEAHDRILRRLLAERAHEWKNQRGIRKLITWLKIELLAWRETSRELKRTYKDPSHRV